jgi:ketosteroid isomerase-like protein
MNYNFHVLYIAFAVLLASFSLEAGEHQDLEKQIKNLHDSIIKGITVVDIYSSESILLPPYSPEIKGKENISNFLKNLLNTINADQIQFSTSGLQVDDKTAVHWGQYLLMNKQGNTIDKGKFLEIWKHSENGWKLYFDTWNTSLPPQSNP